MPIGSLICEARRQRKTAFGAGNQPTTCRLARSRGHRVSALSPEPRLGPSNVFAIKAPLCAAAVH